MTQTAILKCKCEHEAQDKLHGEGQRVHNKHEKQGKVGTNHAYTCTVCGNSKVVGGGSV